jgi:hypothetical protein
MTGQDYSGELPPIFREHVDPVNPSEQAPDYSGPSLLPQYLSGTFADRLRILREAIDDVDSEIGVRLNLSRAIQSSIKGSRDELLWLLKDVQRWQPGLAPSIDQRRTTLETEVVGLYREARSEKQRAFSDIASLRKEKRKLVIEYKLLESTAKMLAE